MNQPTAKFQITDSFKITNRGLAFTGFMLEGIMYIGDSIQFDINRTLLKRKITGIEGVRSSRKEINTGLIIECLNDSELEELCTWKPNNTIANMFGRSIS